MTARGSSGDYHSRIEALRKKHSILSSRVTEAQRDLSCTDFYLRQLKKQKLLVKEELEGIRLKTANAS